MAQEDEFLKTIELFTQKIPQRIVAFKFEFLQDITRSLVIKTPVITGFLRGSWYFSLNPAFSKQAVKDKSPDGAPTVGKIALDALSKINTENDLFLLNNAKYARFVEYGTSRFEGRAFVRRTVAEAPSIANQTIARISKDL